MDWIDIENGKLFRLEGWLLKEDSYELESYREDDQNWESIKFEGSFVEPHGNIDLHNGLNLNGWLKKQASSTLQGGYIKDDDSEYIMFLVPQDCDSLIAGENYPNDTESWFTDDVEDSEGLIKTYIYKKGNILPISFYKTLSMLQLSWEEALGNHSKWFL